MVNFLKYIQSQSPDIKAYYTLGISGMVTGFIAIIWISTLPARFAEITPNEKQVNENSTGFAELIDDTKDQLGTVVEGVNKLKNIDPTANIETSNMDNLSMDAMANGEVGNGPSKSSAEDFDGPSSPETPPANSVEGKPKTILIETKKDMIQATPKVVLIGTTTTQKAE